MTILGIETATETLSVAVVRDGESVSEYHIRKKNVHDRLLSVLTGSLLESISCSQREIDGIAVSSGPGSYTGLRIGMSFAKGYAYGLARPLLAVPTFDGIARAIAVSNLAGDEVDLAVLFDARREDVYVGLYRLGGGTFQVLRKAEAAHMGDVASWIAPHSLLAGNGADAFARFTGVPFRIVRGETAECHAANIAVLGEGMLARGEIADLESCEPDYMREFPADRSGSAQRK